MGFADEHDRLSGGRAGRGQGWSSTPDSARPNQSMRLPALGRLEEALETSTRATEIYEALAADHPDAYLPDLGTALNNQSTRP